MPLNFSRTCFSICFLGSLIFFSLRFLQLYTYGDDNIFHLYSADIWQAFLFGGRFDVKVMAVICLSIWFPVFLAGLAISSPRLKWNIQKTFLFLIFVIVTLVAVSQYYFYGFYKAPFNTLVFGLVEDDTKAVLVSIWDSYPVLRIMLVVCLIPFLFVFLTKHFAQEKTKNKNIFKSLICLIILGICARGSFGTFPLRLEDMAVSTNPFINNLVGNGIENLYVSYNERSDQITISPDPASELKRFGFSSLDDVAQTLGASSGLPSDLTNFIIQKTPKNTYLEQHPPHVIFVLMESWGAHQLRFSNEQTNLAGQLGKYLEKDYYFKNFFSSHIGTHQSLESLLLNTPITPLTLGKNASVPYHFTAAKPFRDKGYKTIFIYGGGNGWRSLNKAIPNLHFDYVYDVANIQKKYPEVESDTIWGTYDENLFRFAYDVLHEHNEKGEKVFLFILTTTNHPPYSLPDKYEELPLDLTEINKVAFNGVEMTRKMALTYQYANNQLGLFIDRIKESPFGEKSIISAAGDHSTRNFFKYEQSETKDTYRIGCLFSVPNAYKTSFVPDLNRYAGHRDIFPTLYHVALSEASYAKFGDSLFAPLEREKEYTIVAYNLLFAPEGVVHAYSDNKPLFMSWKDKTEIHTSAEVPVKPELVTKGKKAKALTALMDWYIRHQVNTSLTPVS